MKPARAILTSNVVQVQVPTILNQHFYHGNLEFICEACFYDAFSCSSEERECSEIAAIADCLGARSTLRG